MIDAREIREQEISRARAIINREADPELRAAATRVVMASQTGSIDEAALLLEPGDVEKASKLDAIVRRAIKPHRKHCRCSLCDDVEVQCPRCSKPCKNKLAMKMHIKRDHIEAMKRFRRRLLPNGPGYLVRLTHESKWSKVNLAALTKFGKITYGNKRARAFTKRDKIILATIREMDAQQLLRLPAVKTTASVAELIYTIALMAGVAPQAVEHAMICYGLEAFSDELKSSKRAPTVPQPVRKEAPHEPTKENPVPEVTQNTARKNAFPRRV